MTAATEPTTQVHRVYIRTSPEAVWDAITTPEWTERYGYQGVADFDLRVGGKATMKPGAGMRAFDHVPDVVIDGEFLEVDPPHRLKQTWRMLMDPDLKAEGFTTLTYEIEAVGEGVTKLTVIHELEHAPRNAFVLAGGIEAQGGGGGWAWVLSDLKTALETGANLAETWSLRR